MADFCFLTYLNRSGSTLLAKKLTQFQDIGVGIEAKFLDGIQRGSVYITSEQELDQYLELNYNDQKFRSWNIPKKELKKHLLSKYHFPIQFNDFLEKAFELYFKGEPKKVYVHKQGRYFNHIPQIREIFPNAKFIFIQRDPRAVYNSQRKATNSTDGSRMQTDIAKFALSYKNTQKIIAEYGDHDYFHVVHYEKLIRDEEEVMNKLLPFLNVTAAKTGENYFDRIPSEQHNLHKNLVSSRNKTERIHAWENELENWEIKFLEDTLKRDITTNNYTFVNVSLNKDVLRYFSNILRFYMLYTYRSSKKLVKEILHAVQFS